MEKYAILVNSCDKYEEAWKPFFSLLSLFWKNLDVQVFLNTETKLPQDLPNVITLNNPAASWGKRLASALNQIDSPYVICFLEDFFLQKEVNTRELDNCIKAMDSDSSIAVFYFNRITGYSNDSIEYPLYYEMKINDQNQGEYFCNCQAALWRKDILCSLVEKCDNPWAFEIEGHKLNSSLCEIYRFFCSKTTKYNSIKDDDVFAYLVDRSTGYGIWRGKWLWNNKKLFNKYCIPCTFSTLPTLHHSRYVLLCIFEILKKPIRLLRKWKGNINEKR